MPLREERRAGAVVSGIRTSDRKREPRRGLADAAAKRAASACRLTPMQAKIARHILEGRSLKQVAYALRLRRRTVEDHVAKLKRKTGSRTLVELVARLGAAGSGRKPRNDTERCMCEFAKRHNLTVPQATVFRLLIDGKTIPEAARILGRHPNTVKEHLAVVRRKAGGCTCLDTAATLRRTR